MHDRIAAEQASLGPNPPLVTIVILNYNYAEFVGRCIASVDRQDYPNIQCLVLDCGSNDDSLRVIDAALGEVSNPFFRLLRREVNGGQVPNYLSALDEIEGTFVTFLDADDFLFHTFVSTHVRAHLNDLRSAAVSVTDQVQVDAQDRVLAGTCHWHQKWRTQEAAGAWTEVTHARSWSPDTPHSLAPLDGHAMHYVPAWWSSWLIDVWIWSAMSGLMFRTGVVESLAPPSDSAELRELSMDSYFARFAHAVGGTLVIDSAQGGYRRHGRNRFSSNHLVLGGQTPSGSRDQLGRFSQCQRVARHTLGVRYPELKARLGGELFYSIAWQLMSNADFLAFAGEHEDDRAIWEKTFRSAGVPIPGVAGHSPAAISPSAPASNGQTLRALARRLPARQLKSATASLKLQMDGLLSRALPSQTAETLAASLYDSLTDAQRADICFAWDHQDPQRGLLRRFIANHWQVTRPVIASDFYTRRQRDLIARIFKSLLDPSWHAAFLRQLSDDTGGHEWGRDQSIGFFGDPRSGSWQFVLCGRHLTLRTGSRQSQVFGGPIVYGHAATGFWEKAGHPGNVFWGQAQAASKLHVLLDAAQKSRAELDRLPEETEIGFNTPLNGLHMRDLSAAQSKQLDALIRTLVAPFRASDRARIMECLVRQGGPQALTVAFGRAQRKSAPDWDDWRLQGPSFVWHWRGSPHVHVWVNVGDDPSEPVNARSGTFIFPEHDPLHF